MSREPFLLTKLVIFTRSVLNSPPATSLTSSRQYHTQFAQSAALSPSVPLQSRTPQFSSHSRPDTPRHRQAFPPLTSGPFVGGLSASSDLGSPSSSQAYYPPTSQIPPILKSDRYTPAPAYTTQPTSGTSRQHCCPIPALADTILQVLQIPWQSKQLPTGKRILPWDTTTPHSLDLQSHHTILMVMRILGTCIIKTSSSINLSTTTLSMPCRNTLPMAHSRVLRRRHTSQSRMPTHRCPSPVIRRALSPASSPRFRRPSPRQRHTLERRTAPLICDKL